MAYHLPQVPAHIRQQVADFIEFLLQKYPTPAEEPLPAGSYRERLMQVSVWRETDVQAIEEAGDYINQWKPESW